MRRFAELLDRLSYTPGRNAKLKLMADYFAAAPDPDRGYALAALTGRLAAHDPVSGPDAERSRGHRRDARFAVDRDGTALGASEVTGE